MARELDQTVSDRRGGTATSVVATPRGILCVFHAASIEKAWDPPRLTSTRGARSCSPSASGLVTWREVLGSGRGEEASLSHRQCPAKSSLATRGASSG